MFGEQRELFPELGEGLARTQGPCHNMYYTNERKTEDATFQGEQAEVCREVPEGDRQD